MNGAPQNNISDLKNSKNVYSDKTRYCSKNLFQRTLKNGEIQRREWLIYSHTKGSVFCVPCLLFGRSGDTNAFTGEGFRDWKNSEARVKYHENSDFHKTNVNHLEARKDARDVLIKV